MNKYVAMRPEGYYGVECATFAEFLATAIAFGSEFSFKYDAWADEWPAERGGDKHWKQLRAESIAAGRLIELEDGRYVARGVTSDTLECPAFYDALKAVYKPMTPTLDKLEAKRDAWLEAAAKQLEAEKEEEVDPLFAAAHYMDGRDLNAEMIARDGDVVTVKQWPSLDALRLQDKPFTSPTAHPALPALTRMSAGDHRLGKFSDR